ncbi:hypothetical protein WG66_000484 [Moniliophthora roreri]|uniref:Uncharacterized protein n=1 Tax=Moniliophthora roreri TaxID=221103 RepID=A0A0W0G6A9_MONRR|nr:hypothetical protein WG66_000484 [Moniliophthora roreri]
MAFFANSNGFNISGGEFSNVARDQYNTRQQTTNNITDSYNTRTTTNYDSYNRTYQYRQDNRDNRQSVNGNYQDRREWAQAGRNNGYATGKAYQEAMMQEQARIAMQQGVPSLPPSRTRQQRPQSRQPQKQQRREPLPAPPSIPIPPVARFNEDHSPQGSLSPQDKSDSDRILASLSPKQNQYRATPDSRSAASSCSNSQRNGSEGELMRKEAEELRSQFEHDRNIMKRQSNDSRSSPSRATSRRDGIEGNSEQKEAEEISRSYSSSVKPPIIAGKKEVGGSGPEAPVPPPHAQVEHAASVHPSVHSPHHTVEPGDRLVSESESEEASTASSQPTGATENVHIEADRVNPEERKSRNPFRRLHRWTPWAWKSS